MAIQNSMHGIDSIRSIIPTYDVISNHGIRLLCRIRIINKNNQIDEYSIGITNCDLVLASAIMYANRDISAKLKVYKFLRNY